MKQLQCVQYGMGWPNEISCLYRKVMETKDRIKNNIIDDVPRRRGSREVDSGESIFISEFGRFLSSIHGSPTRAHETWIIDTENEILPYVRHSQEKWQKQLRTRADSRFLLIRTESCWYAAVLKQLSENFKKVGRFGHQ